LSNHVEAVSPSKIHGSINFLLLEPGLRNCTTDDIRDVLGKYKRESAAKAGQHPGIEDGAGMFFGR